LVESLRVKSIETAFHSDLELVIQKAADDLFHQNKKLLEITKSNSADTLPVTAPSDDRENHVNATRTPSRNTTASSASNSTTKTASIIALQNEIKTLNVTHSLTLTYSLIHSLTHSLLLTYLLTYSLTYSLTHLLGKIRTKSTSKFNKHGSHREITGLFA